MSEDYDEDFASGIACFEAKNFSQAMKFLYPLASAGNPDAQHRVAIMCQNGLGVARNEKMAEQYRLNFRNIKSRENTGRYLLDNQQTNHHF